jgi:hypothetical protein
MTTIRNAHGATVVRPNRGDVVVADRRNPNRFAVIPDPTGKLGEIMRVCAARDQRRTEETR